MTNKIPASLEGILHILAHTRDALLHNSHEIALKYLADAQTSTLNEMDWAFHTDQDLPNIYDFLITISDGITLALLSPSCTKELTDTIIEEISLLIPRVSKVIVEATAHTAPDKYLDHLEIQQKQRQHSK